MQRTGKSTLPVESHMPPQPVAIALVILGIILTNAGEFLSAWPTGVVIGLLLIAIGLADWLIGDRWPVAARWLSVLTLVALIPAAQLWLALPGTLALSAIPMALAAALIGIGAGLAVAAAETALIIFLLALGAGQAPTTAEALIATVALWGTAGAVFGLYQPTQRFNQWLSEYFQRTQQAAEEVQVRRAEGEQALADLEHANRQLALANDRMAALRDIAEDAQKSKAAFVAKVSHEFRTPLNMIIGLVDLLVETPEVYGEALPPALFEDLRIVHRNCEHLSSLVNDVLDLSQAEAGRLTLHQERVSVGEIIEAAVGVVHSLVERKGLTITLDLPADIPLVYCDPTRIRQAVLNLVSNAARFTERGGIVVRAARRDELLTVSVTDTGPGIAPKDIERIFEPFCQGSRGPWNDRGGSGLGLTISKQFIELHGGQMWVESTLGQGATFAFSLPISPPLASVASPGRWISEDWKWVERSSRPKLPLAPFRPRVVVCDETGELASALERYPEEAEIIQTRELSQAADALRRCPAHALLINAISAEKLWTRVAEARAVVRGTPILGCCVPPRLDRARAAGAADYLVRPVTPAQLWEAIAALDRPIRRVLIVDDDPDVRQLLGRMLAAMPRKAATDGPIEIVTAADGPEALDALRENPADAVLLDVVLPGMDGWQVLAQKQQDAGLRDIPVIMVSAQDRSERQLRSEALLATVDGGLAAAHVLRCTLGVSATVFSPA